MTVNTLASGEQLKKYHVALLVKGSTGDYIQISKTTDNTITMNAETVDRDFIVDKSPTTLVDRYKPSLANSLTCFKGDEDYEFFWDLFYSQATGAAAQGTVLVVFMNEEAGESTTNAFKAWQCSCSFICDNLNPVDSTLTFNINFNGTTAQGTATVDESGKVTFAAA